jgi:hypothetical protein
MQALQMDSVLARDFLSRFCSCVAASGMIAADAWLGMSAAVVVVVGLLIYISIRSSGEK